MNEYIKPHFVNDTERQEVLRRALRIEEPIEIQVLELLCEHWKPEIPVDSFKRVLEEKGIPWKTCHSLLQTFLHKHTGLLLPKIVKGEAVDRSIILTDPESPVFFYYICIREYVTNFTASVKYYTFLDTIPAEYNRGMLAHVKEVNAEELNQSFIREHREGFHIFSLLFEGKKILLPSGFIPYIILFAKEYIRTGLSSGSFERLARGVRLTPETLRRNLRDDSPALWSQVSCFLLDQKEEMILGNKVEFNTFLISVFLIKSYTENEFTAATEFQQEEREKQETVRGILEEMKQRSSHYLWENGELRDLLKTPLERWPDFKEYFLKEAGKSDSEELPRLVRLGNRFILSDYIPTYFSENLDEKTTLLPRYYRSEISSYLKKRTASVSPDLSSRKHFLMSVERTLKKDTPELLALLNDTMTLRKVIDRKNDRKMMFNPEKHKQKDLERFFNLNDWKRKDLDEIFHLDPVDLYEKSYRDLGVLSKILLYFSGKKNLLEYNIVRLNKKNSEIEEMKSRKKSGIGSSKSLSLPGQKLKVMKKVYSAREKKRAWKEFGKVIKK